MILPIWSSYKQDLKSNISRRNRNLSIPGERFCLLKSHFFQFRSNGLQDAMMDLPNIPELVLDCITGYLAFDDLVNFSQTCRAFAHLQPKTRTIKRGSVNFKEEYRDGHWCPKTFFDVPINSLGLRSVKMCFKWKDQGWGNQKGNIWLSLVRGDKVIADGHSHHGGLAPHNWAQREVEVVDHDLVKQCVRGDVLRVMRNTGGGGGHSLHVRNFTLRLWFKTSFYGDDDEEENDVDAFVDEHDSHHDTDDNEVDDDEVDSSNGAFDSSEEDDVDVDASVVEQDSHDTDDDEEDDDEDGIYWDNFNDGIDGDDDGRRGCRRGSRRCVVF